MAQVVKRARGRMAPIPSAEEAMGTIGPILAELCAGPVPVVPPTRIERRAAAVGAGVARRRAIRGRMGIHALVYLARYKFGCPGLDPYNFAASALHGVYSPVLARTICSLEEIGPPGGMAWDEGGRFAALVRDHGGDGEWLSAAGLLCMIDDAVRTREDPPSRENIVEEAHRECGTFSRARMSAIYDDLCEMGLLGQPVLGPWEHGFY
ncbi:MAG: hypothetical protein OXU37_06490 [Thaumarchaeota archaeon]|nr:hypothetical protein [Nitrososphaerota archaeon]